MATIKSTEILLKTLQFFFPNQNIKDNERNNKFCTKFIQILSHHYNLNQIGEEWLWQYLIFYHKQRYETQKDPNKPIRTIAEIYGEKALTRYLGRRKDMDWTLSNYGKMFDKKKFLKLFPTVEKKRIKTQQGFDVQEVYRRTRLNQDDGFDYCMTFTTLFKQGSPSCEVCRFKQQCKEDKDIYYKVNGETRTTSFKNKVIKSIHS